jgi:hypothetical protein
MYDHHGEHDERLTKGGNVRVNEARELLRALDGKRIFETIAWHDDPPGRAGDRPVRANRREVMLERQVPVVDDIELAVAGATRA